MKRAYFGLCAALCCFTGCGQEPAKPAKQDGVQINVPGVSVKTGADGATIKAPGVEVKTKG